MARNNPPTGVELPEGPQTVPVRGKAVNHAAYCAIGVGTSFLWLGLGCLLAALQNNVRHFVGEWYGLQGSPLLALGIWLLLIARSKNLEQRVVALTGEPASAVHFIPVVQFAIVATIGMAGTASLAAMGFNEHGIILLFMILTCAGVAFMAALASLHAAELLAVVYRLESIPIKLFRYSPARTPELRDFVNYFTSFGLLLTIGYGFALLGTLSPQWSGTQAYVNTVRVFWPVLYVPVCSIALVYPHLVIHRLIRKEKERTLFSYQREIDGLLEQYGSLNTDEIGRTNTLAQLFDRINSTPNYVLDFGNATRTIVPLAINIASLAAKFAVTKS